MSEFGISTAFGRRAAPRTSAPVIAVLSTESGDYSTELVDLSRTGARLKSSLLPRMGEDLLFKAEKVRCSATVVWLDGNQCALEFDTPLAAIEVKHIRALSNFAVS